MLALEIDTRGARGEELWAFLPHFTARLLMSTRIITSVARQASDIVGGQQSRCSAYAHTATGGTLVDAIEVGSGLGAQFFPLSGQRITIGRLDENDLVFSQDVTVSRRHAVLERFDNGWRIRDLHSSNGTFVNGIKVTTTMRVKPGDRVLVGSASFTMLEIAPPEGLLATMQKGSGDDVVSQFSQRESEILRLVAQGCTDAELAERLSISVKTVHSHLDRIRDKCGLRRRADLTRLAIALGLTS